jgi:hypothetical protein
LLTWGYRHIVQVTASLSVIKALKLGFVALLISIIVSDTIADTFEISLSAILFKKSIADTFTGNSGDTEDTDTSFVTSLTVFPAVR